MAHFAEDVHHRISTRIRDIIPDFVESEYPAFVTFVKAYYEFLEQYDELPVTSTFAKQDGVVSVRAGNSTIIGSGTTFTNTEIYSTNVEFKVGSDQFRIRNVANNTQLVVYEIPVRSYFANTHAVEINKSTRQAAGALRQLLTFHQVDDTLDDFLSYFRDTYLRDVPQGLSDSKILIPRILDFYQAKGSEASYNFLFRALYGKEAKFTYPRESVFTTSDNEWVRPTIIRLNYDTNAAITGNVALLETREIVGLTSNVRATVLQTVIAQEGARRVVRAFISDPIISQEEGQILTESGDSIILTKYGVPPEGLSNIIYEFNLFRDDVALPQFIVGETVSTVPTNDPDAITGTLMGSITGFNIESRGEGYQQGDFVYPPTRYANGAVFAGGFGAVGQITAFTDVDISRVNIIDPGLGYYQGLPLVVDNSGTGGTGLSGYVDKVSSGNLLLHEDLTAPEGPITENDVLLFENPDEDGVDYEATRETVNYYELGISLADLFGGLQLNSDNLEDDGDDLLLESGDQLCIGEAPLINDVAWSTTSGSALLQINLNSVITTLTSALSTFPLYVRGIRTEIGKIKTIKIESFGSNYILKLPYIEVQTPAIPTKDIEGLQPLTYGQIFGRDFDAAAVTVSKAVGQIGAIDLLQGGSGYANVTFLLSRTPITTPILGTNEETSLSYDIQLDEADSSITSYLLAENQTAVYSGTTSSATGTGARVSLALGAVSRGESYFKNTKSFASADQYLQDITKYQPFSYVLSIEEDLIRYAEVLRKLVHPAGGLLLPRQTITTEVDVISNINLEGIDYTYDQQFSVNIFITAQNDSLYQLANVSTILIPVDDDETDVDQKRSGPTNAALILPNAKTPGLSLRAVASLFLGLRLNDGNDVENDGDKLLAETDEQIFIEEFEIDPHNIVDGVLSQHVRSAAIVVLVPADDQPAITITAYETTNATAVLLSPGSSPLLSSGIANAGEVTTLKEAARPSEAEIITPEISIELGVPVSTGTIDIVAGQHNIALFMPITSNELLVSVDVITAHLNIPVIENTIAVDNDAVTLHQYISIDFTNIDITAPEEIMHLEMHVINNDIVIDTNVPTIRLTIETESTEIAVEAGEEEASLYIPVTNSKIDIVAPEETVELKIPVITNTSTVSAENQLMHLMMPVATNIIETTIASVEVNLYIPVATNSIQTEALTVTVHQTATLTSLPITITQASPTLHLFVPFVAENINIDAPTIDITSTVDLSVTYDTVIQPYDATQVSVYETTKLRTFVDWETATIDVSAPEVSVTTTTP